ncbi:MAG: TerC family protein [Phycisphaerales bacterium]
MLDALAAPLSLLAAEATNAAGGAHGPIAADFELFSLQAAIALLTLTALEIVLGIDNIIFIAIIAGKLPEEKRAKARNLGLLLAMVQRILLLLVIGWIIGLNKELFAIAGRGFTGKDIILLAGGVFLIAKAVKEIHEKIEGDPEHIIKTTKRISFRSVLIQIILIDAVFSVDSILTAVGLVPPRHIEIMITAVVISVIIMMLAAGPISRFVEKHPTIKMLALAILVMIGVLLVAEGLGEHFPRGYVYFAMAFSLVVEMLNIHAGKRRARKHPQTSDGAG